MKKSKFVIKKDKKGQLYFIVVASNGKTLCTSESYTSLTNCKKGIAAVQRAADGDIDYAQI